MKEDLQVIYIIDGKEGRRGWGEREELRDHQIRGESHVLTWENIRT